MCRTSRQYMLGDLIYEAEGKITYTKIVTLDPITVEGSYIAEGRLKDGTRIKEQCTFTSIQKSHAVVYGEGKHLVITDNGNITWIGRGFGKTLGSKQIWRGSGIFASELSAFNNIVGVVEAAIICNKIIIKIWEWC